MQPIKKAGTAITMCLALFLAACASNKPETAIVSTLSGNDRHGFMDGRLSSAQFSMPNGIAVDGMGTLYIADGGENHRIRKIVQAEEVSTLAGSEKGFADGRGRSARFNWPANITIDATGNLYVVDKGNFRIRKITPEGDVSTLAGSQRGLVDGQGSEAQFFWPSGIAVDSVGNLYVTDRCGIGIRKITPKGTVSTLTRGEQDCSAYTRDNTRLAYPSNLAIDAAGNLYVVDSWKNRIHKVTKEGKVSNLAGGRRGFSDGRGIFAKFDAPLGIAVDAAGNLYVADSRNRRIRKITPKGKVSTLAGDGALGLVDGQGKVARFRSPSSIAIDSLGNLYVTDLNRIRKIVIQRPE
jgi:DNA-binding beta-propeller fold protein YncE